MFNDLSLEHGGRFHPHVLRQAGLSIDVRYLGSGGNSDAINGQAGDGDLGSFRHNLLIAAQNGNVDEQRRICGWIKQNRIRLNVLFADAGVEKIYSGNVDSSANWHTDSLVQGKYPNGQDILDPDVSNAPLGAWTAVGQLKRAKEGHLSHLHIERRTSP